MKSHEIPLNPGYTDPTKHQWINAAKAATIRRHLVDLLLEDQRMPKALFLTSGTGVWACFCKDKIEMRHACLLILGTIHGNMHGTLSSACDWWFICWWFLLPTWDDHLNWTEVGMGTSLKMMGKMSVAVFDCWKITSCIEIQERHCLTWMVMIPNVPRVFPLVHPNEWIE